MNAKTALRQLRNYKKEITSKIDFIYTGSGFIRACEIALAEKVARGKKKRVVECAK